MQVVINITMETMKNTFAVIGICTTLFIVGIGMTRFAKHLDRTEKDLVAEAVEKSTFLESLSIK